LSVCPMQRIANQTGRHSVTLNNASDYRANRHYWTIGITH